MQDRTANLLGAMSLAVVDLIERSARRVVGRGGETPAALVVMGYGPGMTNDTLRRVLGLSHSGTVRLIDRLTADGLVERRSGRDGREVALHLTPAGQDARRDLMSARLEAIAPMLDVLSPDEVDQLDGLLHALLARQPTTEMDRYTLCRLCDDRVCVNCPLPTTGKTGR